MHYARAVCCALCIQRVCSLQTNNQSKAGTGLNTGQVVYEAGCSTTNCSETDFTRVESLAKKAKATVLVLGTLGWDRLDPGQYHNLLSRLHLVRCSKEGGRGVVMLSGALLPRPPILPH